MATYRLRIFSHDRPTAEPALKFPFQKWRRDLRVISYLCGMSCNSLTRCIIIAIYTDRQIVSTYKVVVKSIDFRTNVVLSLRRSSSFLLTKPRFNLAIISTVTALTSCKASQLVFGKWKSKDSKITMFVQQWSTVCWLVDFVESITCPDDCGYKRTDKDAAKIIHASIRQSYKPQRHIQKIIPYTQRNVGCLVYRQECWVLLIATFV